MTPLIPYLITALVALAAGIAGTLWSKSRAATTKTEAMKVLIAEAALVAKMPSASDAIALAQKQAKLEAETANELAQAILAAAGVPGAGGA
jgi:hypothetical protein